MRIKAFITTYERKQMLEKTVEHLNSFGIIPQIKDDGSTYKTDLPQYFRHKHRGKKKYWITWHEMFKDCQKSNAELFLFMPDDFERRNHPLPAQEESREKEKKGTTKARQLN